MLRAGSLASTIKNALRLKTPSAASNIIYTLLSVALTIILLIVIPHSVYKNITQQSLNTENLAIGPDLQLFIDRTNDFTPKNLLDREPELTQTFKGHAWLQLQLSSKPV
jgi:hypothetical protein